MLPEQSVEVTDSEISAWLSEQFKVRQADTIVARYHRLMERDNIEEPFTKEEEAVVNMVFRAISDLEGFKQLEASAAEV